MPPKKLARKLPSRLLSLLPSSMVVSVVIATNPLERLKHDYRVAADNL